MEREADNQRDKDLISSFLAGDESSFAMMMQLYREKIFSVSLALLRNRADAEEITQDTFIRAHRGLRNFRGDSSLPTWLHRIAVNLARNRYWYWYRRRRHITISIDAPINADTERPFLDLIPSEATPPDQETTAAELEEAIERCKKKLSFKHREILELLQDLHYSYEQISEALCVDVGTVKSRVARARQHLWSHLEDEYANIPNKSRLRKLVGE